MRVVLASTSPTRAALLEAAGVSFTVQPAAIDENDIKAGLEAAGTAPADLAGALADAKATSLAAPQALVIGADQTMEVEGACLHKPTDLVAARRQLQGLRGRSHQLHSAVALARDGGVVWRRAETARLTMRPFSDAFLEHYLARHGESLLGSVGGYRLEDDGAQLFASVDGDYFTILGLPRVPLLQALREQGALEI